ncbi:MAG: Hsp20/alpha crystallin family protein [Gemmatimonadaceae bacterium]
MTYRSNLVVGGPFAPLFGLRRDIDRLFDDTFTGRQGAGAWSPAIDVRENEKELAVEIELPGMKAENVDISVENGVLMVRGEKPASQKEEEDGQWHVTERSYGSFYRALSLPQGVEEDKIEADFADGVLTVRVPKAALPQPRKIRIAGKDREVGMAQGRERLSEKSGQESAASKERSAPNDKRK